MAKRLNLQKELEKILGSRNVYFQPPETLKIKYPCIVYELSGIDSKKADNKSYLNTRKYTITLIHDDPDNDIIDKLLLMKHTTLDKPYEVDNLYHYVFTTYY